MANNYEEYFKYLKNISLLGRLYKRWVSSPILFFCTRPFGKHIAEIGSGAGSGILGAFPSYVVGLDINPFAVDYLRSIGLRAELIKDDGIFPLSDKSMDACVLDNVLEHVQYPKQLLDECWRVTKPNGGLIIAVPGRRGFSLDADHKKFYEENDLRYLDSRWQLQRLFSLPFFIKNTIISGILKQYCLIAVYQKA